PSIFALCQNSLIAENVGMAMQRIYHDAKIESNLYISAINHEGAVKL
ncbi:MAG: homoserine kinase, partial [Bacteroidetes bacterium]